MHDTDSCGTPSWAALARMRLTRSGLCSMAMARRSGRTAATRWRSNRRPRPHPRAAGPVAARDGPAPRPARPAWSAGRRGRRPGPGGRGSATSPPPRTPAQTRLRAGAAPDQPSAVVSIRVSVSAPRSLSTVSRVAPKPASASSRATAAGLSASRDSTISRRPGLNQRRSTSIVVAQPHHLDGLVGPAHPGPGQRHRRDGRVHPHLLRPEQFDQGAADPRHQRIPAGQGDHGRPARPVEQLRQASVASGSARSAAVGPRRAAPGRAAGGYRARPRPAGPATRSRSGSSSQPRAVSPMTSITPLTLAPPAREEDWGNWCRDYAVRTSPMTYETRRQR